MLDVDAQEWESNFATFTSGQTEEQQLNAAIAYETTLLEPKDVAVLFDRGVTLIPHAHMYPNAVRASQACMACRKRKVRCVPVDLQNPSSWCKSREQMSKLNPATRCCSRCVKMGMECIWAKGK